MRQTRDGARFYCVPCSKRALDSTVLLDREWLRRSFIRELQCHRCGECVRVEVEA